MPFITIVAAQLSELQEDKSLSVSEAVVNRRGRRGEGWERGEGKTLQQTETEKGRVYEYALISCCISCFSVKLVVPVIKLSLNKISI